MTRFGNHLDRSARELVEEAVAGALSDAGIEPGHVQGAVVGNAVSGLMSGQEAIRAQAVLRRTGLMGVPMVTVEDACASSSAALHLGWQAVAGGIQDCVLVVGFEKLYDEDRAKSVRAVNATVDMNEHEGGDYDAGDLQDSRGVFMDLYASISGGPDDWPSPPEDREALALVSVKNHHHGRLNPFSQFREEVTVARVLNSRPVAGPLTLLMCSPLSDGAACLILTSAGFNPGGRRGVRIAASVLTSGRGDDLPKPTSVERAARRAYELAGAGPDDLDLVELHDATSLAELHLYEELGLCARGDATSLIRSGRTWLGGRLPVNPSGGLLSRGHPIGATGAAQVVEATWQLRGSCGDRQVPGARMALTQNAGGWVGTDAAACAVHILQT
jgi:acetyl-CoA acetyltransferase